jgi:hypothetical protein
VIDPTLLGREAARATEIRTTEELERIPGVLAAAVWMRDARGLREAYVTGAPGASPLALRHAVQEVLRRNGLIFDPNAVHVAVLDEATAPPPLWRGRYLVLHALEVGRADHHVACTVQLLRRGSLVSGKAVELDSEAGRARAAARATLLAAEQAARGIRLGLEGVQVAEHFGRPYLVVSVEAAFARRFAHLPGIAPLDRSIEDAACFAVLSAIERWLAW